MTERPDPGSPHGIGSTVQLKPTKAPQEQMPEARLGRRARNIPAWTGKDAPGFQSSAGDAEEGDPNGEDGDVGQ